MNQTEKSVVIEELAGRFTKAPIVVLSQYKKMTVAQMTDLRLELRKVEGELLVAKNTLTWRAVMDTPNKVIEPLLSGPTVFAFGYGDPAAFAKALDTYADKSDVLELKGAVMDGVLLDRKQIAQLAKMPSRDQLRAQLLALMMTPATQLVRVLAAPAQQVAQVLDARRRQLEEGGAAAS
ncbi:MAG TPA: 50S ribosomal protein L10 [Candidatus Binatia bacterium]|nr:50S ribosomal protein L10 [Candidatus Binatia bacterium]